MTTHALIKIAMTAVLSNNPPPGSALHSPDAMDELVISASAFAANTSLQTVAATVAAQNLCIIFGYDLNDNRTAQSNQTTSSAGAVWGSSTFPCFLWSSGT
jgi:hypothetical protein